jgi:hypothetical protein
LSLVLVHDLLVSGPLGGGGFLALLDFSDGFLSKSLLLFGASVLELFDVIEGDTFNGSFFSEDFLLLVLALIS